MSQPSAAGAPPIERAWTALLVVVTVVAAWHPITSPDVFFHLSLGRAVVRARSWLVPEPASFLDPDALRVVPQWLWDVAAYGLHQAFGFGGLVVVTMGIAGLATWLVCRLVAKVDVTGSTPARMAVSGLAATAVMAKSTVRPQTMFMLLLPAWMLLSFAYEESRGRRRIALGVGLVAVLLFWVHVHGSFVVAPVVWLVIVAPRALRRPGELALLRLDVAVGAGLGLALLTNAYGLDLLHYLRVHGSSDAVSHNLEMISLGWTWIVGQWLPTLLWAFALFGAFGRGERPWSALALLGLGVVLAFEAARFVSAASLLAAPLAVIGAANLDRWAGAAWPRYTRVAPVLAVLLVVPAMVRWFDDSSRVRAPIGRVGITPGEHPELAWARLQALPRGSRVFSSYTASAQLGFWADGHLRTYIDGRTPLHFDDTDFAIARDAAQDEVVLWTVLRRYGVRAAVVSRESPTCRALDRRWKAVVIEPRYSTFVPDPDAEPLVGLEACGVRYVSTDACARAAALDRSLDRLTGLGPSPLTGLLRAERLLRCGGDAATARLLIPDERDAFGFRDARRRTRVRLAVAVGDLDEAEARLREAIEAGDYGALSTLGRAGVGVFPPERARSLLELVASRMDDHTPANTRASLAGLCVRLGDLECAHFHATRAALHGDERALAVLEWLAANDPSQRGREDARAWIRAVRVGTPGAREAPADR